MNDNLSKIIFKNQHYFQQNLVDRQDQSRLELANRSEEILQNSYSPIKKVKFKVDSAYQQENNTSKFIQQGQINSKVNSLNALYESKVQQSQNYQNNYKYQYGKESVDVKQGVLKRFQQQNYTQQFNTLQKFKAEAEQFRKTRFKNKFNKIQKERDNKPKKQPTQNNRYLIQLEQKRSQRDKMKLMMQKQNMFKVGNMLRNISYQLHKNSQILKKGISGIKDVVPISKKDRIKIANFKYSDTLDFQAERLSRKIPIVIYNNKAVDARIYYNLSENMKIIDKSQLPQTSKDMDVFSKILKSNNDRLKYLAEFRFQQY